MGSSEQGAKRLKGSVIRAATLYATLIAIAWCALFPILWALSGSLKNEGEISEPKLLPAHPRWSNYSDVFALMPFWRMTFNTVLYAGCVTAGHVFFCSLAGYAFARLQFRGRDTLFVLYLGTLMVPLTVTVIPQFLIMRTLGWVDTPWAMIVPGLFGSAFGTYLMRSSSSPCRSISRKPPSSTAARRGRSTGGSCCPTRGPR